MRFVAYTGFILFLLAGQHSRAQNDLLLTDPILIRLRGRIISASDSSAVPYANIINNRTHSGTITNLDGYFSFEMLNVDSLEVTSVGFQKKILKRGGWKVGRLGGLAF